MCGICGIFGEENREKTKRMLKSIAHRGPDDEGMLCDDGVSIGNRRLSIIDVEGGHQPVHDGKENTWVVYNGETYNYMELREELGEKRFHTNSDTEVFVHAYNEWGDLFANRLNGMFAFALWDSKKKRGVLGRDRLGIKPLYYAFVDGSLVFGSEIKCLLEYGIPKSLDMEGVACYLRFGSVFGERTFFENVKKLLPGEILVFENGKIEKKRYWNARDSMKPTISNEREAVAKVRSLLEDSVEKRLMSEVPLGAFLSGGIDSSATVGIMSRKAVKPVETFSVGFGEEDDELSYARIASDEFGTNHHELMVEDGQIPGVMEKLVWHFDDLDGDAAAIPTYFVSKLARKYVTVVLTGEGADEVFAGYNRYKPFSPSFFFVPKWISVPAFERIVRVFGESEVDSLLGKPAGNQSKHLLKYFRIKGNSLNQALLWGMEEVLPNQLLMKVDKTSMANSLEARVPFLDYRMVEYGNSLVPPLKMHHLTGKYILRKAVEEIVPKTIVKRKKHGFSVPMARWMRGELGEFADGVFERFDSPSFNRNTFREFAQKREKYKDAQKTWHLLLLALWIERFAPES